MLTPIETTYGSWRGGSILAALKPHSGDAWIKRFEYEEHAWPGYFGQEEAQLMYICQTVVCMYVDTMLRVLVCIRQIYAMPKFIYAAPPSWSGWFEFILVYIYM